MSHLNWSSTNRLMLTWSMNTVNLWTGVVANWQWKAFSRILHVFMITLSHCVVHTTSRSNSDDL